MRNVAASHRKLTTTNRGPSSKPILSYHFNHTRSCQRTQHRPFYHHLAFEANSLQLSSVAQSCPTLCDCSTPGFPVHHQLPELAQTHVHRVRDAIQLSHPVVPFSSCHQSFPASGSSQMNQFFTSGGQSVGVSASVLPMNIQD